MPVSCTNVIANVLEKCNEKCIVEKEDQIIVTIPKDILIEYLVEEFRNYFAELINSGEIVNFLKENLPAKNLKNLKGRIVHDLDGLVFIFDKKNTDE